MTRTRTEQHVTRGHLFAAVALLMLALGVLGMHITADLGGTAHAEHSSKECHHHDDCAPAPMSNHVGTLCVVAIAVAVAAATLLLLRRTGAHTRAAPAPFRTPRPNIRVQDPVPQLSELCILRC
jgi:hypothetical protein